MEASTASEPHGATSYFLRDLESNPNLTFLQVIAFGFIGTLQKPEPDPGLGINYPFEVIFVSDIHL